MALSSSCETLSLSDGSFVSIENTKKNSAQIGLSFFAHNKTEINSCKHAPLDEGVLKERTT